MCKRNKIELRKYRYASALLYCLLIFVLVSCNDRGEKTWSLVWYVLGFPFIFFSYILGGFILEFFGSKKKDSEKDSSDPVSATLTGAVILFFGYRIIRIIFSALSE